MVAWKQIYVHVIDYNTSMAAPKQMQSTDYKYSITIFALKQNDTDSCYWLQHHYSRLKTDTDSCCCLQVEHDHDCLKTEWYGFLLQTTRPLQLPEIHLPVIDHHHEPQNCYSYIKKRRKKRTSSKYWPLWDQEYICYQTALQRQAWQMALLCVHKFFLSIPTNTPLTPQPWQLTWLTRY